MATHSSMLAWRILWTEEPGGLYFVGSQRVRHDWMTNTFTFLFQGLFPTQGSNLRLLCPQIRVVLLKRRWGAWTGGGRDTSLPVWYGLETINPFVLTQKPSFSSTLILYAVPVGSHPFCLILDCKVSFGCRDSWTCNQLISSHLLSRNSSSKKIRKLTLK